MEEVEEIVDGVKKTFHFRTLHMPLEPPSWAAMQARHSTNPCVSRTSHPPEQDIEESLSLKLQGWYRSNLYWPAICRYRSTWHMIKHNKAFNSKHLEHWQSCAARHWPWGSWCWSHRVPPQKKKKKGNSRTMRIYACALSLIHQWVVNQSSVP